MAATVSGAGDAATRVRHFVRGAHRLAITSESLAGLLGLVEDECREALETMAATGLLRKEPRGVTSPLYCKE